MKTMPATVNPPVHVNTEFSWLGRLGAPRRIRSRPRTTEAHLADGWTVVFVDSEVVPPVVLGAVPTPAPVVDAIRKAIRLLYFSGKPVTPVTVATWLVRNEPALYGHCIHVQIRQILREMGLNPSGKGEPT